ncbi:MAG TPA: hypothetical protein VM287_14630 [Egibacteraceae bacterium]|nr:hypothetical protein [Egibacteraceae bacterium]
MASAAVHSLFTRGIGNWSHVATADGAALLVDIPRDVDRVAGLLEDTRAWPVAVADTHVHNDFLSGNLLAAARYGCDIVTPAPSGVGYAATPAFHNEPIECGPFNVTPIHTPGHTPEHTSYLVAVDGEPRYLFSGGSILAGALGRADLLGAWRERALGHLQLASARRLLALPDDVVVHPTHGQGSFCAVGAARTPGLTVAEARDVLQPLLETYDAEEGTRPVPAFYTSVRERNLHGVTTPVPGEVPEWGPEALLDPPGGAIPVDIRPRQVAAAGYVPGSLLLEQGGDLGLWAGWLLAPGTSIVLVAEPSQDVAAALVTLATAGLDRVAGYVTDVAGYAVLGGELSRYEALDRERWLHDRARRTDAPVVDVRWAHEVAAAPTRAVRVDLPALYRGEAAVPSSAGEVWVGCASGYRASLAAGILRDAGYDVHALTDGGLQDVMSESA